MPTLAEEAKYLHAALFGGEADALTVARYEAAHARLFAGDTPSETMATVIERRLDVEAVEFALRRRESGVELTRKVRILCYFAEARAAHLAEFVNLEPSRTRAWTALAAALLRVPWKLAKGEYAIRRHGLR